MNKDLEHPRLLSIFHYVLAGIAGLFSLIPILHISLGIAAITGRLGNAGNSGMPPGIGWFFVLLGSTFMLGGLTFSACLGMAGRFLAQRRRYTYCLVMAAVSCAFMPCGTVLGVFTIIELQRDSVKLLFGREVEAQPAVPPAPGAMS